MGGRSSGLTRIGVIRGAREPGYEPTGASLEGALLARRSTLDEPLALEGERLGRVSDLDPLTSSLSVRRCVPGLFLRPRWGRSSPEWVYEESVEECVDESRRSRGFLVRAGCGLAAVA